MYELIVIWLSGEKETYTYNNYEDAKTGEKNFKMAFGHQISFTCINRI